MMIPVDRWPLFGRLLDQKEYPKSYVDEVARRPRMPSFKSKRLNSFLGRLAALLRD